MGDRALVIFTQVGLETAVERVSPTVYLHWGAEGVPAYIKTLAKLMHDRRNDVDYACARFTGIVHADDPKSNLSLGVFATDAELEAALKTGSWTEIREVAEAVSHGDGGVVIVDTNTFNWRAFGGYLENENREGG